MTEDRPMKLPTAAIVGRQNVGKSTLFNVLLEEPRSVVSPLAGTTRDRNIAEVSWRGRALHIVDTGGIEIRPEDALGAAVRNQAEHAIREADVVCFVVDGKNGLTEEDRKVAGLLRASGKPVVVAINKLDSPRTRAALPDEMRRIGFRDLVLVSAKNGVGTGDLLDRLFQRLPETQRQSGQDEIALVLFGKPNVGKSSIMNRLLGEERVIVSPEPHTTRDPQDTLMVFENRHFRLVDTAGIRRRVKLAHRLRKDSFAKVEQQSVEKGLRALRRADVAAIIFDVTQAMTKQDRHLFQQVEESGVGVILVANKWDLVEKKTTTTMYEYERTLVRDLPFLSWAPLVFVSAATGQRLTEVLRLAARIHESRANRLTDRSLERFMKMAIARRTPPRTNNVPTRLIALQQTGIAPPTFHLLIGPRQSLPTAYRRFLINMLREYYHFFGTTIRLVVEQQLRT